MTKQQFSFNGIYFVDNNKGQLSHSEVVELLNTLHQENQELKEENEQLKKLIERKDILLKNRTEYIEDRIQSFNDFISYMDTFLYKSDVDPNDVKQDIMNILQKWEIKKGSVVDE